MKTKISVLMIGVIALLAASSVYLISHGVIPLPDLMFTILFAFCGVWMLFAASLKSSQQLVNYCAAICFAALAVLAFWAAELHADELADNLPFIPSRWAHFTALAMLWGGGCICARLALLFFLHGIRTWKQTPILPLILIRCLIKKLKKPPGEDGGSLNQYAFSLAY